MWNKKMVKKGLYVLVIKDEKLPKTYMENWEKHKKHSDQYEKR